MENVAVVNLSALLGLTLAAVLYLNRTRHQYDLPPGPPPHLFSGSTYQIPSSEPWKAYAKWSQVYGESSSFWFDRRFIAFPYSTVIQEAL